MMRSKFCRGLFLLFFPFIIFSCHGQEANSENANKNSATGKQIVGGPFENADYIFMGMPEKLNSVDTSPGWKLNGQHLLITGTIYKEDGTTPAPGVILYYYHTNLEGKYLPDTSEKRSMPKNKFGQTHGYIRGWIKTGDDGRYSIYTVRPGVYPSRDEPAHIHLTIKEPNISNPYYIDELVFDDDQLLTSEKRRKLENRGGSGILRVLVKDNLQVAEHDIILGLNIPGYPGKKISGIQSGLQVGESQPSFTPFHASGPDKGTHTCPVCKYGRYFGILFFVGNDPDWNGIKKWLTFLEQESISRGKYVKAYFIYGNENNFSKNERQTQLENIGQSLNIQHVALTFVPSFDESESDVYLNKINPGAENTFIIYKHGVIIGKFINLQPSKENYKEISSLLDRSNVDYFNLPEPLHN